MSDPTGIEALAGLVGRLENNREFMAHVLAAYRKQEGLSEQELAAALGVTPALLVRLALCRRPAADSPDFTDRLRRIADATLIDEAQLASVIRQVEILERLSGLPGIQQGPRHPLDGHPLDGHPLDGHPLDGLMAAARDRSPAESEEPAPHEDKKGTDD
jgi:transcriptional regulator with XRE-family HTH domain